MILAALVGWLVGCLLIELRDHNCWTFNKFAFAIFLKLQVRVSNYYTTNLCYPQVWVSLESITVSESRKTSVHPIPIHTTAAPRLSTYDGYVRKIKQGMSQWGVFSPIPFNNLRTYALYIGLVEFFILCGLPTF